mmetsp:Transcript_4003/g.11635  ORF Transcript_4003/g.11635 Transcript_4003/m.11635 type:complete len:83 (-) Transcript_4003:33-281(-)
MRFFELAAEESSPPSAKRAALVVKTRLFCTVLDLRSNCDPNERSMASLLRQPLNSLVDCSSPRVWTHAQMATDTRFSKCAVT